MRLPFEDQPRRRTDAGIGGPIRRNRVPVENRFHRWPERRQQFVARPKGRVAARHRRRRWTCQALVTPLLTAGTLSAKSVVTIPSNMVTSPMVPTSPDGSNICTNYNSGSANTVQVGTAGGYLFVSQVDYTYTPAVAYGFSTTIPLGYMLYMSPRLI